MAFRVGEWVEQPLGKRKGGGLTGVVMSLGPDGAKKPKWADVLVVSVLHLSFKPPQLKTFSRERLSLSRLHAFKGTRTCSLRELEGFFLTALSTTNSVDCTGGVDSNDDPSLGVSPPSVGVDYAVNQQISSFDSFDPGCVPNKVETNRISTEVGNAEASEGAVRNETAKSSESAPEPPAETLQEINLGEAREQYTTEKGDGWIQRRRLSLLAELEELSSCSPAECKQRLRALQLELHPDKHAPESRPHVQKLFCLVQGAWDKLLGERVGESTPPKRKANEEGASSSSPEKKAKPDWNKLVEHEYKVHAKIVVRFFRGSSAQVIKGKAKTPQGLAIVCNESGNQIQTFGLSNNLRFSASEVHRCFTGDISNGNATITVEMLRPGSSWTFWLYINGADPQHLQRLVGACAGAAIVDTVG